MLWKLALVLLLGVSSVRADLYDPPPGVCSGGIQAQRPPSGTAVIDQPPNDYSGGVPASWKTRGNTQLAVSADKTYVIASITDNLGAITFPLDNRYVAGAEYSIQAWVKLQSADNTRLKFTINYQDASNNAQYDCAGAITVASSSCWTLLTGGYTQQLEFASATLLIEGAPAGSQIFLRSVSLVLVNLPNVISPDLAGRTDALRKRGVYLKVTDSSGSPISGASVAVDQIENSFPFGASIQGSIVSNPTYQQFIKSGFNYVVFQNELKWYAVEPNQGQYNFGPADGMLAFAQANNLKVRGHNIFWEDQQFVQPWVQALSVSDLRTAMDTHLRQVVNRYKGKLVQWDVDNESLHFRYLIDKAGTSVDGRPIEPWMYAVTKQLDPGVKTALNEYNIIEYCQDPVAYVEAYIQKAQSIINAGGVVEILGIQGQFLGAQPQQIRANLDRLALFGIPVWLTEVNVNVGDDSKHALYLEKILREAFAHPAVGGILLWNVWEPAESRPNPRVLTNLDFSLNLAGQKFFALRQEWKTTGVTGTTDAGGNFPGFRGFFGTYSAKVTVGGQTFTVPFTVPVGPNDAFITIKTTGTNSGTPAPTTATPSYLLPNGQCDYTQSYTTCYSGSTGYCCQGGCYYDALQTKCYPQEPVASNPAPTTPATTTPPPGPTSAGTTPAPSPTTPAPTTAAPTTATYLLPDGSCDYTKGYTTCYDSSGSTAYCCRAVNGCSAKPASDCLPQKPAAQPNPTPAPAPTTPTPTSPGSTPTPPTPTTNPPSGTPVPTLPDGQCDYTKGYTTCYENGGRFCCQQGCPYPLASSQSCVRVTGGRRRKVLEV